MIVIINTALIPHIHQLLFFLFLFNHLKHTLLQVCAELRLIRLLIKTTPACGSSEHFLRSS